MTQSQIGRGRATISRVTEYLIPVEGLTIDAPWQLGAVRLLDAATTQVAVAKRLATLPRHRSLEEEPVPEEFQGTAALIDAPSIGEAADLAATALDVVRAFQQSRTQWQTTMFGIAGQVTSASMPYLAFGKTAGFGWRDLGHHLGWTFDASQREAFIESPGFNFLAAAIGKPQLTTGERKALLGVELASRAMLEHRPTAQLLYAMIAAETLLLSRRTGSQTWRLARRAMFLVGHSDGEHCGRDMDTCPFLALSPDSKPDLADIKRVRDLARHDIRWRCSEWLRVLDWYDIRSDIVHAGATDREEESGKVVYWLATRLIPACLEWFASHPDDPFEELDRAIDALPDPPDWQRIIEGAAEGDAASN